MLFSYTIPDSGANNSGVPDVVTGPAYTQTQTRQSSGTYIPAYTYLDGLGQVREKQIPAGDGSAGRRVASVRYDSAGYTEGTSDPYYNASAPGSGMVNPAVASLPAYHDLIVDWAGRTTESQLLNMGTAISAEDILTSYYPDITTVTPPVGPVTDTLTDIFGNTTQLVQHVPAGTPSTITTSYSYDDTNHLTQITDNNNDVSSYTYNWAGQRTAAHDPDAGDTSTQYDANGNVTSTTDASGQTITTLYDTLNRPTTRWAGAAGTGTKLAFYTYDTATLGKNRAASSTSYNAGNAYTQTVDGYDVDGRSLGGKVTIPAAEGLLAGSYDTTTASYDAADHPLTVGYPAVGTGTGALAAETVTAGYNNRGEPKTLTGTIGSTTYVSATSYLNWGPLSSRTYGTGTLTAQRSYGWNQTTGWLTNITTTVTNAGTPSTAQNDTYGYDKMGDVREIASTAGTAQQQCYTYDGLNRLAAAYTATTATVPTSIVANCGTAAANHSGGVAPYDLAYTYDSTGLGNINTITDNTTTTPTVSTYTYPGASDATSVTHLHAVTTVARTGGGSGSDSYGYNANGAMNTRTVAGVASTLTWDPQQRLASVTSGGNTTSFIYDSAGNRLLRKSPTETVLYLPVQELHLAGTVVTPTRYYSCGTSTVAQRVGGGALTWLTSDNQNSAQIAVDTTTGAYTQQRYLPFGAQRGTQGPPTGSNRSYLGHNTDPTTGLLQDGARYYDPNLARFISPDPIATPYDPQNLNAYSYSANNPIKYSDPTGLRGCDGHSRCVSSAGASDPTGAHKIAYNEGHRSAPTSYPGCDQACQDALAALQHHPTMNNLDKLLSDELQKYVLTSGGRPGVCTDGSVASSGTAAACNLLSGNSPQYTWLDLLSLFQKGDGANIAFDEGSPLTLQLAISPGNAALIRKLYAEVAANKFNAPIDQLGGMWDRQDPKQDIFVDMLGMITRGRVGTSVPTAFFGSYNEVFQVIGQNAKLRTVTIAFAAFNDTGVASLTHIWNDFPPGTGAASVTQEYYWVATIGPGAGK